MEVGRRSHCCDMGGRGGSLLAIWKGRLELVREDGEKKSEYCVIQPCEAARAERHEDDDVIRRDALGGCSGDALDDCPTIDSPRVLFWRW